MLSEQFTQDVVAWGLIWIAGTIWLLIAMQFRKEKIVKQKEIKFIEVPKETIKTVEVPKYIEVIKEKIVEVPRFVTPKRVTYWSGKGGK